MSVHTKIDPEERSRMARAFFRDGYNCCQSVLLAFQDIMDIPAEAIAGLASGFGGGMGRLREVCGAMSATTFIAGLIKPAVNPGNMDERTANYALVQQFAQKFREANGSIVCREILQLRADKKEPPVPSERTVEYYTNRPCERIIGNAAIIIAEELTRSNSPHRK